MLMMPGLAFFYGWLVGRKNVMAIMIPKLRVYSVSGLDEDSEYH
jgi:ammonia channel protein AmtB